ncbi:hypothetical protein D9M69_311010 [compost metagenome]
MTATFLATPQPAITTAPLSTPLPHPNPLPVGEGVVRGIDKPRGMARLRTAPSPSGRGWG